MILLTKHGITRQERADIIRYLLSDKKIPIHIQGIYKLLKRYNDGKTIRNTWNDAGRTRLLEESHMKTITNDLINTNGFSIGTETIEKN